MSSVHAGLNVRLYFQYMENIARMLTSIGHDPENGVVRFARGQYDEQAGLVRTGIKDGPALFVDHYTSQLIDAKSNNLVMERGLQFAVMMPVPQKRDYDLIVDAKLQCETVAMQVVSRIYHDRRTNNPAAKKWINVLMDSLTGDFIEGPNMLGFEVMIPVQNKEERLTYDPGLWDDDAAAHILQDLTGISCENLNHPTLGLTSSQRLNCLGVRIYESDGTTLNTTVAAGGTFTLPEAEEMPTILPYANEAAALADTTTTPTTAQTVRVLSTRREYAGDGTSKVNELVAAQAYLLPVSEQSGALITTVEGTNVKIQLNL